MLEIKIGEKTFVLMPRDGAFVVLDKGREVSATELSHLILIERGLAR